jgi:dephospho-CoA kinase
MKDMTTSRRLIGLTGTNGAGKGEAAEFFKKHGYAYHSLSDLLREELARRGEAVTRDNLIRTGNALRHRYGADILARRVMKRVRGRAIIDSIRHPREIAFLKKQKGFLLLAVDAPAAVRFERVKRRGRDESATTLDAFIRKEQEEMTDWPEGQQLHRCLELADRTIVNDSSREALHRQLEEFL